MAHYYFHVSDGERTFKDEVGRTFATPVEAEGHAVVIASELAAEDGWQGFSVIIETKEGCEITRVAVHL